MKDLQKLKDYIYPNGKYSNIHSNSKLIKKYFPEIYEMIKDNYHTKLFMLLNNINEIPNCKNPNCNNKTKLKSISKGFRLYCSNKCIGQHQHIDKNFSEKIKKTCYNKNIKKLQIKFPNICVEHDNKDKNYYIIKNYCSHSPFSIYRGVFQQLNIQNKCLCYKCNELMLYNYIPSIEEINIFKNNFKNFYEKHHLSLNNKWLIYYFPKEYKIILEWTKHLDISLSERIYMFKNNLKDIPICPNCNKNNLIYRTSFSGYTKFCNSPACNKNTSTAELELYNYLYELNNTTNHKFYINKKEYDIIIEDRKILVEFNGLYWHSDEIQQNKNYHHDKWKTAVDNGYQLFTIWEDDWDNKKDIIKSMLKYKLQQINNIINTRKCEIKEVESNISKEFLEKNHLQGKCVDHTRIGLFYENKLVSLMTFGKRKISNKTQFELLRFVNIINTSVPGSASRLFNYFIDKYNPDKIISYASLDYSNGNLYDILSFKKLGETGINYWWVKGKQRYHRTNFMKWKLIKQGEDKNKTEDEIMRNRGYYKIWNSGNLKYEWVNI